jgi:hypothetical protein
MPLSDLLERRPSLGLSDGLKDVADVVDLARKHVRRQDPLARSAGLATRQPQHDPSIARDGLEPALHGCARRLNQVAAAPPAPATGE